MISTVVFITLSSFFFVYAQQVGTQVAEIHPRLSWEKCTAGTCQTQTQGAIVLDANFRPTHSTSTTASCYTGNTWNATLCPDGTTCAMNCALEGVDYYGSFGVASGGNSLALKLLTISEGIRNVGSRVYLLADDSHYEIFHLLNQEFTFDVDVSQLPCGLNGALYFSQMDADGGYRLPTNTAGPKYGTGYCDAQCPRNLRFVNGVANSEGWTSSSGEGNMGTCCSEMDIWEANSVSAAYTPHPCQLSQQTTCNGTACGGPTNQYGSPCDPDGCDFNSFRMGDTSFYGKDLTVDTSRPFTVVTQFLTGDNTSTGTLSEIRRLYIQNGQVIQNSNTNIPGMPAYDSITEAFCDAQKTIFGSPMSFQKQGGVTQMGAGLAAGMVLVMSLWDDSGAHMLWLDSDYPANASTLQPGVARGTCATSSGVPSVIESQTPNAHVVFSNIKFGDIGSTWECRNE